MQLAEMTWPEVDQLPRSTPVVLPVAAVEQHGRHMPVFTDSLLLGEIVKHLGSMPIGEQVLIAPLQWLGNSHHHCDMPGTMSASPRLYLDLLHDLADAFLSHGFERIVFLNGHGGNKTPSEQVCFELRQKHRDRIDLLLLALTYWDAADPTEILTGLGQSEMGHAGEWETSMMLAIRPDLVRGDVADVPDISFGNGAAPGYRGWIIPDRSEPGHIGKVSQASAETGAALVEIFSAGVADFLQRMTQWNGDTWEL